jgi:hypothetical protein
VQVDETYGSNTYSTTYGSYGDTDYRYEMEGDRKYDDDYDKSSLGEMGYQSQEFDDNGELVNSEDDYVEDDYTDDSFDGSDDEF